MSDPETSRLLEARLMVELATINRKIQDLQIEKTGLERLLVRIRREEVSNKEVGRKNSARRVLIEKAVLDRLAQADGKSVTSHDLWRSANDIELNLKKTTFRSYLHRMKVKGLVQPARLAGRWQLPTAHAASEV